MFNEHKGDCKAHLGATSVSNSHGVLASRVVGPVSQRIHSNNCLAQFLDVALGVLVACSEGIHSGAKVLWCLQEIFQCPLAFVRGTTHFNVTPLFLSLDVLAQRNKICEQQAVCYLNSFFRQKPVSFLFTKFKKSAIHFFTGHWGSAPLLSFHQSLALPKSSCSKLSCFLSRISPINLSSRAKMSHTCFFFPDMAMPFHYLSFLLICTRVHVTDLCCHKVTSTFGSVG